MNLHTITPDDPNRELLAWLAREHPSFDFEVRADYIWARGKNHNRPEDWFQESPIAWWTTRWNDAKALGYG